MSGCAIAALAVMEIWKKTSTVVLLHIRAGHSAVGSVCVSGYTVSWCRLHRRALYSGWCGCFRVHCQLVQITQKGIVQWVVGVFQGTLSAGTAVCARRGEPRLTGGENVSHQQQPVQSMLMEAIVLVCS